MLAKEADSLAFVASGVDAHRHPLPLINAGVERDRHPVSGETGHSQLVLFGLRWSCPVSSGVERDDVVGVGFVGEFGDDGAEGLVLGEQARFACFEFLDVGAGIGKLLL